MTKISDLLKKSLYTVVLTGAGMSTESGLPDFRSQGGLWDGRDPMEISSVKAMEETPEEFTEFFTKRIVEIQKHEPNEGHKILAKWEEEGLVHGIITQNIDGYHQQAGSKNVIQVHGGLDLQCEFCKRKYGYGKYLFSLPQDRHKCFEPECIGFVRPNVTLFGELLDPVAWFRATQEIAKAHIVIVMGTSAQVQPVASLPMEAMASGARIIVINRDEIDLGFIPDHQVLDMGISDALRSIDGGLHANEEA